MTRPEGKVFRISHVTRYVYSESASLSLHKAFLTPRPTRSQTPHTSRVTVDPSPVSSTAHEDYYGNQATLFTIDVPHQALRVEAESELAIRDGPETEVNAARCALGLPEARRRVREAVTAEDLRAYEFVFDSPHVPHDPALADYALACFREGIGLLDGVRELTRRIHSEFRYDPTVTTVSTPVSEVFRHRGGVCQDFAHLMIACLRSLGVPARYVSGYLVPGEGVIGAQASHAWVSAYCPETGWTDFDPTNDVSPSGQHITVAWGRDYSDVSPFRGVVVGGGRHEVSVEVSVRDA